MQVRIDRDDLEKIISQWWADRHSEPPESVLIDIESPEGESARIVAILELPVSEGVPVEEVP